MISARGIAVLGTARQNRLQRFFTPDSWKRITGKQPYRKKVFYKNTFKRKVLVLNEPDKEQPSSIMIYYDKQSAGKPVLLMTNTLQKYAG